MLYLGTTVLILFDISYTSRFWTQFEAWLSMQFATPNGLKSAVGTKNARYHIVCIQNAAEQAEAHTMMLVNTWATKTPQQAFDFLSKPDVTVTNQSDKQGQLPKIRALDATVQGAFQAIKKQSAAQAAAALRAEKERRARAAAAREASVQAVRSAVGSCLCFIPGSCVSCISGCGTPEQVKHFRGPCAACCKPLAPCCCVSADGEAIFCCVPTDRRYFLPACLHMALCPQLGCDPKEGFDDPNCKDLCLATLVSNIFFCCLQSSDLFL
jgi:hypothetical protein